MGNLGDNTYHLIFKNICQLSIYYMGTEKNNCEYHFKIDCHTVAAASHVQFVCLILKL